jgi:hypothetical protein
VLYNYDVSTSPFFHVITFCDLPETLLRGDMQRKYSLDVRVLFIRYLGIRV